MVSMAKSAVGGTYVGLPQILRWYHCLQLVKYFLLVPLICCMAQTLGLKQKRDKEEKFYFNSNVYTY